jgi:hypothetical protein
MIVEGTKTGRWSITIKDLTDEWSIVIVEYENRYYFEKMDPVTGHITDLHEDHFSIPKHIKQLGKAFFISHRVTI